MWGGDPRRGRAGGAVGTTGSAVDGRVDTSAGATVG